MLIPLKYAQLHEALFLAGTNLQMKLDPSKRTGLSLALDLERGLLLVYLNGEISVNPLASAFNLQPIDQMAFAPAPPPAPRIARAAQIPPRGPIKAQVSTPHDHVFAERKGL